LLHHCTVIFINGAKRSFLSSERSLGLLGLLNLFICESIWGLLRLFQIWCLACWRSISWNIAILRLIIRMFLIERKRGLWHSNINMLLATMTSSSILLRNQWLLLIKLLFSYHNGHSRFMGRRVLLLIKFILWWFLLSIGVGYCLRSFDAFILLAGQRIVRLQGWKIFSRRIQISIIEVILIGFLSTNAWSHIYSRVRNVITIIYFAIRFVCFVWWCTWVIVVVLNIRLVNFFNFMRLFFLIVANIYVCTLTPLVKLFENLHISLLHFSQIRKHLVKFFFHILSYLKINILYLVLSQLKAVDLLSAFCSQELILTLAFS